MRSSTTFKCSFNENSSRKSAFFFNQNQSCHFHLCSTKSPAPRRWQWSRHLHATKSSKRNWINGKSSALKILKYQWEPEEQYAGLRRGVTASILSIGQYDASRAPNTSSSLNQLFFLIFLLMEMKKCTTWEATLYNCPELPFNRADASGRCLKSHLNTS